MGAVTDARLELAAAVTAGGIECAPYPPDSLSGGSGYVDSVTIEFAQGSGFSFCFQGMATASITTVGLRNDRAGTTQALEDLIEPVLQNLEAIEGVKVVAIDSGTANIAGADLPAILYTCQFGISNS